MTQGRRLDSSNSTRKDTPSGIVFILFILCFCSYCNAYCRTTTSRLQIWQVPILFLLQTYSTVELWEALYRDVQRWACLSSSDHAAALEKEKKFADDCPSPSQHHSSSVISKPPPTLKANKPVPHIQTTPLPHNTTAGKNPTTPLAPCSTTAHSLYPPHSTTRPTNSFVISKLPPPSASLLPLVIVRHLCRCTYLPRRPSSPHHLRPTLIQLSSPAPTGMSPIAATPELLRSYLFVISTQR